MRRPAGFTLLQLLAWLAVATVLMLLALPTYIDKLLREQVAEAMVLAGIPRPAVAKAWENGDPLPADNNAAGLAAPNQIANRVVRSVTVEDGAIHILFGNQAHRTLQGRILTLRPAVVDEVPTAPLTWVCGYRAAQPPRVALGSNRTTVQVGLVPRECR